MSSGSNVTNERAQRLFVSTYAPGPYAAGAGEYQVQALPTEKPYYSYGCKRRTFYDKYLQTFNLPRSI